MEKTFSLSGIRLSGQARMSKSSPPIDLTRRLSTNDLNPLCIRFLVCCKRAVGSVPSPQEHNSSFCKCHRQSHTATCTIPIVTSSSAMNASQINHHAFMSALSLMATAAVERDRCGRQRSQEDTTSEMAAEIQARNLFRIKLFRSVTFSDVNQIRGSGMYVSERGQLDKHIPPQSLAAVCFPHAKHTHAFSERIQCAWRGLQWCRGCTHCSLGSGFFVRAMR